VQRFNLHTASLAAEPGGPPGYGAAGADIGEAIGAEHLAGGIGELAPGQKSWPYHWEAGQEEWLIVLSGTPTLRAPEGERELRPGDVVCFRRGPEGAHQLINHGEQPARLVILSDRRRPNVVMYPDSEKVGVRTDEYVGRFRLESAVEYWDREP
jgi:uncharacterized cupin superfamily protein